MIIELFGEIHLNDTSPTTIPVQTALGSNSDLRSDEPLTTVLKSGITKLRIESSMFEVKRKFIGRDELTSAKAKRPLKG
jgi:hypothetical protein